MVYMRYSERVNTRLQTHRHPIPDTARLNIEESFIGEREDWGRNRICGARLSLHETDDTRRPEQLENICRARWKIATVPLSEAKNIPRSLLIEFHWTRSRGGDVNVVTFEFEK